MQEQQPVFQPLPSDDNRFKLLEEKIISFKELIEQKFIARDKALEHQADIYEARLQNLNHENERIQGILDKSIPREVHEKDMATLSAKIQLNSDWILKQDSRSETKDKNKDLSANWIKWVLGIIVTVLLFYIGYILKK